MPILAIDTATLVSGVAVATEKKLLAELTLQTKLTHSEVLMPHIKQILDMTNLKKSDLEAVAISIGPGSFTGLRIGLATAKSIAYALNIPIIGVSTLAALAYHYPVGDVYIAPMLDAQKGNIYISLHQWKEGKLCQVYEPTVKSFTEVLEAGQRLDKPVVFLGEKAVQKAEEIQAVGGNIIMAMPHMAMPRAANVAMLGWNLLQNGKADDVMSLEPLYIRRSEAEVLWEKRNGVKE